ncbi:type II toxin-antitoxin system RelE/ParE family toxin [Patescibacteria group bacterium]
MVFEDMYRYYFAPQALKEIKKIPQDVQKRIIKKLDFYCQKDPLNFADFLVDSRLGNFRFRIGDYRIVFDKISVDSTLILKVGHRREIYRRR